MRITRNYMSRRPTRNYVSGLLNGNGRSNTTSSLLQSALSKSSRGQRSRLNSQSSRTDGQGRISTRNLTGSANSEKLYYNMKYHAGQVYDYAERLNGNNKESVYEKAKASSAYSSLFNGYGSKGNYFNFFR